MFCSKCGHELPDNAVFCNSCGASMQQRDKAAPTRMDSTAPSAAPHAVQNAAPNTQSAASASPGAGSDAQPSSAQKAPQPKKKKRTGAIAAGIAAVLVVAAIAVAAAFTQGFGLLKPADTQSEAETQNATQEQIATEEVYVLKAVISNSTSGNSTTMTMTRNEIGDPVSITAVDKNKSGKTISSGTYEYKHDESGNVTGYTTKSDKSSSKDSYTVQYDSNGRITKTVDDGDGSTVVAYSYDSAGSLSSVNLAGSVDCYYSDQLMSHIVNSKGTRTDVTYTKDDNGRPTKYKVGSGSKSSGFAACSSISYDENGNVSRLVLDGGSYEYQWEKVSRPTSKAHVCSTTYSLMPELSILCLWTDGLI